MTQPVDDLTTDYEADRGYANSDVARAAEIRKKYAQPIGSTNQPIQNETVEESGGDIGFFNTVGDIALGVVRGPLRAIDEAGDTIEALIPDSIDPTQAINKALFGDEEGIKPNIPKTSTITGGMVEGVTQFLTGFLPATRAVKSLGVTGSITNPTAAGAVADAAVFDAHEDRLSNLIQYVPGLQNPVTAYLAADEDDSVFEGKLKNVLEGAGLGVLTDGIFRGIKAVREWKQSTPTKAASAETTKETIDTPAGESTVGTPELSISSEQQDDLVDVVVGDVEIPRTESGSFNTDHITNSDDIRKILDATDYVAKDVIEEGTRGVVSHKNTQETAELLGTSVEDLNNTYKDTRFLDARMLKARQMLAASGQRVVELAAIVDEGGGAEAMTHLRKAMTIHASIQAEAKGVQTEIARALNAMKIDVGNNRQVDEIIEAMGGMDVNRKLARRIVQLKDDPRRLNKFVQKSAFAKWHDVTAEIYINSILSGPATQAVNIISNGLVAISNTAERYIAAGISAPRRSLGGQRVEFKEANAHAYGFMMGIYDAFKITSEGRRILMNAGKQLINGKNGFKDNLQVGRDLIAENADEFGTVYRTAATGEPILDNAVKFEHHNTQNAITAEQFEQSGLMGQAVDFMGGLIRLPGRALVTSDELFKAIGYRAELHATAYRIARQKVVDGKPLSGEALAKEINNIIENPPKDIHYNALDNARYQTFTKELGTAGQSFQRTVAQLPFARFVVPFIRTPVNIMKYVGERTPVLNLLSENIRGELEAGGARADIMKARTATGTALYTMGYMLASDERITGSGPFEVNLKTAWGINGRRPYSIKVGDQYYQYNRMDPLGAFFGVSADLHALSSYVGEDGQISEAEFDDLAVAAVVAISKNIVSKTYMKGVTDVVNALHDPDRYGEKWFQNFVTAFSPNFFAQTNRTSGVLGFEPDPEIKEVFTIIDAFKARLPGYSQDVPPLRDLFGEPVLFEGGFGPDVASPLYTSSDKKDPIREEIARLETPLSKLPKQIMGVDLDAKQYDAFAELTGKNVRKALEGIMGEKANRPEYVELTDNLEGIGGGKQLVIRNAISKAREFSRKQFLADKKNKRLLLNVLNARMKEAAAVTGGSSILDDVQTLQSLSEGPGELPKSIKVGGKTIKL